MKRVRKIKKENKHLREVRSLVFKWIHPDQADVFLFGSWAAGQVRRHSDIDLGVLPKKPLPEDLLPNLREALEESRVPYHVEIVDLSATDSKFKKLVLERGMAWKGMLSG